MISDLNVFYFNNRIYNTEELIAFSSDKITIPDLPEWEKAVYRFILDFLDDKDYIIQNTSGTTGEKKILKIPKQAMIGSAQLTTDILSLNQNDSALLCLPIEYIAGKMMVVRSLVAKMNLIISEPKGVPDIQEFGTIDFCAMVPLQVNKLLDSGLLNRIKTLIIGGAEIGIELEQKLKKLSNTIYETYGMAETCSHVALRRVNGTLPEFFFKALPGVELELDSRGCLIIDAPFLKEKVITNDIVELKDNNRFKWLGRFDNLINTGGIKVHPEMLEKQIEQTINLPCAVIGLPDSALGKKIVLFIESTIELDKYKVAVSLKNKLDKKLVPKEIYILQKLPRNESFKVDKKELRKMI